jgi:iron complex outermembrane receptor protein
MLVLLIHFVRFWLSIKCASFGAIILFNLLIISRLAAQSDTVQVKLAEVQIYGIPFTQYLAGVKIQTLDSLALRHSAAQNIADLLMNQTGIYFKQYGNGMLASVAFRGTGASHTAVLWNGLNINALTYGQTDFSLLSVLATENLSIQYGSASALYGSDALGGAINLSSQANWGQGLSLDFQQVAGSFGLFSSNANVVYSNKKFETKTRLYYSEIANNFEFKNIAAAGKPFERQNNAASKMYGAIQEWNYRFAKNRYLSLKAWYSFRHLAIQPTMSANQDFDNFTQQQDDNLRLMADYFDHSKIGFFNLKLAYLYDNLLYNQSSRSATNRLIGQLRYEKSLAPQWSLQAGINTQQVLTNVDNYAQKCQENRSDIFAFLSYKPLKIWHLSLNIRQAFVSGFSAPLAPSLGSQWQIFRHSRTPKAPSLSGRVGEGLLSFKFLASRNYRVPTLNDRFWNPGGNPQLRSDSGWSAEVGLVYQYKSQNFRWESEITHYQMWVNDWILWQPQVDFWRPQNQRQVHARGLELNNQFYLQGKKWQSSFSLAYAYTQSTNQADAQVNFQNKQLPYTPLHRLAINANFTYQTWWLALNWHYTSLRYETLDNLKGLLTSVPAFQILNFSGGKSFKIQNNQIHITLKINNLSNVQYQNYLFRAMPGIHYQIGLNYQFTSKP